ncbi:hypothetical protein ACP4OV_018146 [Aristida adscensionis]
MLRSTTSASLPTLSLFVSLHSPSPPAGASSSRRSLLQRCTPRVAAQTRHHEPPARLPPIQRPAEALSRCSKMSSRAKASHSFSHKV